MHDNTALRILDRTVERSAWLVTRRKLLRNAGSGALGLAALVAFPIRARAAREPVGSHVCGPSPYCNDTRCYSSGACHNTGQTKPRAYTQNNCIASGDGYPNCWNVSAFGNV